MELASREVFVSGAPGTADCPSFGESNSKASPFKVVPSSPVGLTSFSAAELQRSVWRVFQSTGTALNFLTFVSSIGNASWGA